MLWGAGQRQQWARSKTGQKDECRYILGPVSTISPKAGLHRLHEVERAKTQWDRPSCVTRGVTHPLLTHLSHKHSLEVKTGRLELATQCGLASVRKGLTQQPPGCYRYKGLLTRLALSQLWEPGSQTVPRQQATVPTVPRSSLQKNGVCSTLAFLLGIWDFGVCYAEGAYMTSPPKYLGC